MYAFGNPGGSKPVKRLFTFPFSVPAEFFACASFDEAIHSLPCVRCGSALSVEAYRLPRTRSGWSLPLCAVCLLEIAGRDLTTVLLWFQRQSIDAMVVAIHLYNAWSKPNRETGGHRYSAKGCGVPDTKCEHTDRRSGIFEYDDNCRCRDKKLRSLSPHPRPHRGHEPLHLHGGLVQERADVRRRPGRLLLSTGRRT